MVSFGEVAQQESALLVVDIIIRNFAARPQAPTPSYDGFHKLAGVPKSGIVARRSSSRCEFWRAQRPAWTIIATPLFTPTLYETQ